MYNLEEHNMHSPITVLGGYRKKVNSIYRKVISGRSIALVGSLGSGKTTILESLSEFGRDTSETKKQQIVLTKYIDLQTFGNTDVPKELFWEEVFSPIGSYIERYPSDVLLKDAYFICRDNKYHNSDISNLLKKMPGSGVILLLLIDEFETILYYKDLITMEFLGRFRSYVSHYQDSFKVVFASRIDLLELNIRVNKEIINNIETLQRKGQSGLPFSSYFDMFHEEYIKELGDEEANELFDLEGCQFSENEKAFFLKQTGNYPLWLKRISEEFRNGCNNIGMGRKEIGREELRYCLFPSIKNVMDNNLGIWSKRVQVVFFLISALHMDGICEDGKKLAGLSLKFENYVRETDFLEKIGYINKDEVGKWKCRAEILLFWVCDKFGALSSGKMALYDWLSKQEFEDIVVDDEEEVILR
jgi:energy-coupling factor transporter ATP-binding protein EcfA2